MTRRGMAAALAALALYTLVQLLFWQGVLWDDRPLFANDYHQIYNVYDYHRGLFRAGESPAWHPYNNCGQNNSCEAQNMFMGYPLNLVIWLNTSLGSGLKWFFALHFLIAACGMYLLARSFGQTPPAAFFAGLVYSLWFKNFNLLVDGATLGLISICLFPLLFWLVHSALRSGSMLRGMLAVAGLALHFAGGHPQYGTYFNYFFLAYAAAGPYLAGAARPVRQGMTGVLAMAGIIVLALALNGVTLLPTLADNLFNRITVRAVAAPAFNLEYSLAPYYLLTVVFPGSFGIDMLGTGSYAGAASEYNIYIGIVPLLLALLAMNRRLPRSQAFVLVCAVGGTILALGRYSVLGRGLIGILPFISIYRMPAKFIIFAALSVSLLAGQGLHCLIRRRVSHWQIVRAAGVIAILLAGARALLLIWTSAADRLHRCLNTADYHRTLLLLTITLLLLFVVRSGRRGVRLGLTAVCLFGTVHVADMWGVTAGLLQSVDAEHYTNSVSWQRFRSELAPESPVEYRIMPRSSNRGSSQAAGIFSVSGAMTDARLRGYHEVVKLIEGVPHGVNRVMGVELRNPDSALVDLLNVRYVLSRTPLELDKLRLLADDFMLYGWDFSATDQWRYYVYENTRAQPRFWVVGEARVIPDAAERLDYLRERGAELPRRAVVEQPLAQPLSPGVHVAVETQQYDNDYIRLAVTSDGPGLLVSSELYHPDWHAVVNGVPAPVMRVNHAFRGLVVPPGESRVEFSYEPALAGWGRWLAYLALAVVVALAAVGVRRRREVRPSVPGSAALLGWVFAALLLLLLVTVSYHANSAAVRRYFAQSILTAERVERMAGRYETMGWFDLARRLRETGRCGQ